MVKPWPDHRKYLISLVIEKRPLALNWIQYFDLQNYNMHSSSVFKITTNDKNIPGSQLLDLNNCGRQLVLALMNKLYGISSL